MSRLVLLVASALLVGCVLSDAEPRIVGGTTVTPTNKYPWMAVLLNKSVGNSLTSYGQNYCGGSRITSRHILTAAHCDPAVGDYVEIGRHDLSKSYTAEGARRFIISKVTKHPNYNTNTQAFDVAIVELSEADTNAAVIGVVSASTSSLQAAGTSVTVSGWGGLRQVQGTANDVQSFPTQLQEVNVPVVSQTQCSSLLGSNFPSTTAICAGNVDNGGVDSCQGDSGGPLFGTVGGSYIQIGLVSSGIGCALARKPGIYTDLLNANVQSFISGAIGTSLPTTSTTTTVAAAAAGVTTATPTATPVVSATPTPTPTPVTTTAVVAFTTTTQFASFTSSQYLTLQAAITAIIRTQFSITNVNLAYGVATSGTGGVAVFRLTITVTTTTTTRAALQAAPVNAAAIATQLTSASTQAQLQVAGISNTAVESTSTATTATTSTSSKSSNNDTAIGVGVGVGVGGGLLVIISAIVVFLKMKGKSAAAAGPAPGTTRASQVARASRSRRSRRSSRTESSESYASESDDYQDYI